ncbi:flagellar hook-length control protein FliK [Massilia sp. YIM B02443]|uniref:flagellar hook-length control protein FliK n=1 Tax=Massilia sp. YIM B02443 TaxID=3050127 RepID=UPI0025B64098|nr:flagellar hook-length control protein FliK [Massilia sp. YIM B02443]MDN4035975.1 flagellar hook-length control protein FliK [Massilia sp. YIM B02443]
MTLSMNSVSLNTAMNTIGQSAVAAGAGVAPDAGVPAIDPLLAGPLPAAAAPAPVLPFQQWIGVAPVLPDAETQAPADPLPAANDAEMLEAPETAEQPADALLLAAMSAPLMPASLPSAMPAMMKAMPGVKTTPTQDAAANAAAPAAPAAPAVAAVLSAPASIAPASAPAANEPAPAEIVLAAATRTEAALVTQVQTAAAATKNVAAAAALAPDAANADSGTADAAPTGSSVAVAAPQPTAARGADSVALSGPPAAWRQTLHEALGERLQLQAGRGVEQATIRLEPPMLGRIDIAIRHSAGSLEVHIAASNGEVLRQLNTVSDALRSDLAGRQFSSVSVSVSETPRAQATAQAGNQPGQQNQAGADAQGRGRQPGQDGRSPGLALNDAGDADSLFSMNGRD